MKRRKKRWAKTYGGYGNRVTVCERAGTTKLFLRWWDSARRNWRWRSLGHSDHERGEQQAKQLAGSLLAASEADATGSLTVAELFARFEAEVTTHGRGQQPREDRRRMAIWTTVLGPDRQVRAVDRSMLDTFVRDRRAGRLVVSGFTLSLKPSERAIGADLEFLRRALNWALTLRRRDGTSLLEQHALQGYPVPKTVSPLRPVADYDRYLALRAVADDVDAQGLFGPFLDLVAGLGWRVSAVCQLRASDFSPQQTDTAPFGRLRKRGETDKEGVAMWVPISGEIRAALATLLERNPVAGETPLFPAPRASNKAPWTRYHARSMLQRAEKRAGLTALEGGDFHPYRRAWATARKHLPLVDVASAGGWKSTATLLRCYMQPDEATLYRVVSESVKLCRIGAHS
jgi:integrase